MIDTPELARPSSTARNCSPDVPSSRSLPPRPATSPQGPPGTPGDAAHSQSHGPLPASALYQGFPTAGLTPALGHSGSGASLGAGAWSTGGFATPSTLVATAGGSIAADALYASGERDKAGSQPRSAADAMEAEADEPLRRSLYANNRDFQPEARELAAMLQCVDETQPAIPNPAGVVHLVEDGSNAMASPFASPDPMSVPGRSILRSLVAHPISVVSTSSMRSSLQVDLPPGEPQGISPLRSKPTQFDAQPAYASRPAAQQVQHAKPSNSGDSLIHDPKAGKQDPSHRTDQGSSSQEAGKLMWDDSALELDSPGDPDLAGKPSVLAQKRYSASRRSRSSTDAVSPQHPKDKQYTRAQQEFIARVKTDMSRPRPKSMSCAPGAYDTLAALDIRRDRRMDPRERTRLWLDRLEPLDDEILKRLLPSVSQPSSRPLKDISETNDTAEEVPVAVAVPVVTAREHNAKHGHRLHRRDTDKSANQSADATQASRPGRFACFACFTAPAVRANMPPEHEVVHRLPLNAQAEAVRV